VRVTDDAGEPLAGAQVQVQRFQYAADGQRRLTNVPMECADGPRPTIAVKFARSG
jgi:hypothetical protein